MSILKNFVNPWESGGDLGSQVLGTNVLDDNVLEIDSILTTSIRKGTHFYDEEGNLLYKSKYGKRAITIVFKEYIEYIKDLNKKKLINVEGRKTKEIDESYIKILRKRYGHTYLIDDMLQIYEKSKRDKRTIYNQYDEDGELKIPSFTVGNITSYMKLAKVPVEVACPLSLNEVGEVIVGDFETELAIGDTPLHIYDYEVLRIKNSIKYYSIGFLHTEPIVGIKNISVRRGDGVYNAEDEYPDNSFNPSSFDESYYGPKEDYFSIIIRPYSIIFFKTKEDYFQIFRKDLP